MQNDKQKLSMTDGPTDRPIDRPMDRAGHRDPCTWLKIICLSLKVGFSLQKTSSSTNQNMKVPWWFKVRKRRLWKWVRTLSTSVHSDLDLRSKTKHWLHDWSSSLIIRTVTWILLRSSYSWTKLEEWFAVLCRQQFRQNHCDCQRVGPIDLIQEQESGHLIPRLAPPVSIFWYVSLSLNRSELL